MSKSGQQPSKADVGGQRPAPVKAATTGKSGTGSPLLKPQTPSSGKDGAKKG